MANTLFYSNFEQSNPTLYSLSEANVELTCSSICERRRDAPYRKMIWRMTEVGNMGETLHNEKASSMLCHLADRTYEIPSEKSMTMFIVTATGML